MNLTESSVCLYRLRCYAFHGVLPQERKVGGWYVISLSVGYPLQQATVSDRVEDTLNYATLCDIVKAEMAIPSALLEHVGARIATSISTRFPQATSIHLELIKENPPISSDTAGAGITLNYEL